MADEWHRCAYLNDYEYNIVSRLEINKSDDDDDGARSVHNRVIRNVLSRPRALQREELKKKHTEEMGLVLHTV